MSLPLEQLADRFNAGMVAINTALDQRDFPGAATGETRNAPLDRGQAGQISEPQPEDATTAEDNKPLFDRQEGGRP